MIGPSDSMTTNCFCSMFQNPLKVICCTNIQDACTQSMAATPLHSWGPPHPPDTLQNPNSTAGVCKGKNGTCRVGLT